MAKSTETIVNTVKAVDNCPAVSHTLLCIHNNGVTSHLFEVTNELL